MAHQTPYGSRLASIRGRSFESLLAILHDIYMKQGLAKCWHNGTKGAFKNNRDGETVFIAEESQPDYGAILASRNGRFVAFDAKVTADQRYTHPVKKAHQCLALHDAQAFGAIAFLLVLHEPMDGQTPPMAYVLWPQSHWQNLYKGWSIKLGSDLDPAFGIQVPAWDRLSEYCPDWASLILQLFP